SITVPYTFFKEQVSKGNVQSIYSRGDTLTGRFRQDVTWPPPGDKSSDRAGPSKGPPKTARQFATTLPAFVDQGLRSSSSTTRSRSAHGPSKRIATHCSRSCSA